MVSITYRIDTIPKSTFAAETSQSAVDENPLPGRGMTAMRDVAKLVGVAPTTVFQMINRSGYISQETGSGSWPRSTN
jgi:DNA-binding transcriptional regulator YhcF (GntR family)